MAGDLGHDLDRLPLDLQVRGAEQPKEHPPHVHLALLAELDGDGEGTDPTSESFQGFGEIVLAYDPDIRLPDGIPWPILAEPIAATYKEGAP